MYQKKFTNANGGNKSQSDANRAKQRVSQVYGTQAIKMVSDDDVIFVNVEGVPAVDNFDSLSDQMQSLWGCMASSVAAEGETPREAYAHAGSVAEFARVACISVGVIRYRAGEREPYFVTQTYEADVERDMLADFVQMVDNFIGQGSQIRFLCAHGIRRGALPFLAKRLIINDVELPIVFDPEGRKPVGYNIIDTADFWTMGDVNAKRVPTELMANVLGIDAQPEDYNDAEAAKLYKNYCLEELIQRSERKLLVNAQIARRLRGYGVISPDHVIGKKRTEAQDDYE